MPRAEALPLQGGEAGDDGRTQGRQLRSAEQCQSVGVEPLQLGWGQGIELTQAESCDLVGRQSGPLQRGERGQLAHFQLHQCGCIQGLDLVRQKMLEHDIELIHTNPGQALRGQHVDLLHRKSLPQRWRQGGQLRRAEQLDLLQREALDLGARQAEPLGLGQGLNLLGWQGGEFVADQAFELIQVEC